MSVIEGIYYRINHKYDGRVLDGKGRTDEVYLNQWNEGDYQRWAFESVGDGWFKIVHKYDARVLDGKGRTDEVYLNQWNEGDYQKWKFESVGDGWFKIVHKHDGRVLDGKGRTDEVYLNQWNTGDYQKWSFEMVDDRWRATADDIVYDATQPPTDTHPVDIISNQEWSNDSPAKISETIERSITKESTFEWGLTESLKTGVQAEFKASVPFIGSAKTQVSVELGLQAHQTWSETTSETYKVSRTVSLEARSAIRVHGYVDWADDFKTPFTLKMWVSATADSISGPEHPLTAEQLKKLLQESGFTGRIIDDTVPNQLLVSLTGDFTGSYGMTTHVSITEIPLTET